MKFDIITIFPRIFDSYFNESILKRALAKKIIFIDVYNLRDYARNKHNTVDDTPYGGGAGMLLKVEPIFNCIEAIKEDINPDKSQEEKVRIVLFSAKGHRMTQRDVERFATYNRLIMICGRYEGVDERVVKHIADEELSIGDYVLTGGEIPAMAVVDSVARLIPGVLGNDSSATTESHFFSGYKEHPHYTKPAEFNGWKVPEVLQNGNHSEIKKWREKNAS